MALVNVQLQIDDEQLIPGPQGPQGEQGIKGAQGPQGIQGPAGSGSSQSINIMDYGGTTSGDNTPALNAALAACVTLGKRSIEFPAGFFSFQSQPNLINGIKLIGQSKTGTYLVRDYSGNFLNFGGGFLADAGVKHMGVLAGAGTSGGYALHLPGQDGVGSADWATFEDIYLSSNGGTFDVGLLLDGQLRTTPQGVRSVRIKDCDFFAATVSAIQVHNGVALFMDNVGTYPAGGTNGDVIVSSGSTIVCMENMNIQGNLIISNSQKVTFNGHLIGLNISANASKCFITGTKGGGTITQSSGSSYANLV